jgi:hypothetical protein
MVGMRRGARNATSMSAHLKSFASLIEDAVRLVSSWKNGKSGRIKITIANEEGAAITLTVGQKTLDSPSK